MLTETKENVVVVVVSKHRAELDRLVCWQNSPAQRLDAVAAVEQ
jgi:hypothetical protein